MDRYMRRLGDIVTALIESTELMSSSPLCGAEVELTDGKSALHGTENKGELDTSHVPINTRNRPEIRIEVEQVEMRLKGSFTLRASNGILVTWRKREKPIDLQTAR